MELYQLEELWQILNSFEDEKRKGYSQSFELSASLSGFRENHPLRPVYGNIVLSFLNPTEPKTSWIIREILAYREKKAYPVLQDFLLEFFGEEYKVVCPLITAEKARIDVLVRDSNYVLIIENKLKGADYQPHQLARYISRMQKEHPNKAILLALIPDKESENSETYLDNLSKSVWRLPGPGIVCERQCDNAEITMCVNCRNYRNYDTATPPVVLTDKFAKWLSTIIQETNNKGRIVPERETRLISTINLFSDYLNKLYNIDINKDYDMDVQEFLKGKLDLKGNDIDSIGDDLVKIQDKLSELNELQQHLIKLKDSEECDFIEKCAQRMKEDYPHLDTFSHHPYNQGWETGIEIKYMGIQMYVHINSHNFGELNTPRWGLWLENVSDEDISTINKEILENLAGRFELSRSGNQNACLFVPSEYSDVYERWKELMDTIIEAKRKNE